VPEGTAGRLVPIDDTRLFVAERGPAGGAPLIVLHGAGMDHHEFGDYLDPLADRYRVLLVDQRSQGRSDPAPPTTWTLERMAQDVIMLARSLSLRSYAVLGHAHGAFVALQHAVDFPGMAAGTVVSCGVPSMRFVRESVPPAIAAFAPPELRDEVVAAWRRESGARTSDDVASILRDGWPFAFADPKDPRIDEYVARTAGARYDADVLRHFAATGAGGVEVLDRLAEVTSPMLVLAGRHDRICPVSAAEAIAAGAPGARLRVLERSGHLPFVEEPREWRSEVRTFLDGLRDLR
jgi:pimeloyl-ACP methyl ester carboxylesterase